MKIYMLKSEDVTNVGSGGMNRGSSTNYEKPFDSFETAASFAETEYTGEKKISWSSSGGKKWSSGDLSYVMYTITEQEVGTVKDQLPKMIHTPDINLEPLKNQLKEYVKWLASDKAHGDSDWDHYIYETTLTTFYGPDIFKNFINKMLT